MFAALRFVNPDEPDECPEIYRLVIKRPNMTDESQDVPTIGQGDKVELGAPAGGGDPKDGKKKCGC